MAMNRSIKTQHLALKALPCIIKDKNLNTKILYVMRTKHLFITSASISLLTLAACQKEEKTTAEKIQGKWRVETLIQHGHDADEEYSDTTYGTASDYVDFRADGRMYSHVDNEYDTTNYAVQNDLKIVIDNEAFSIQTLTDDVLKLYSRDSIPNSEIYYEIRINLKK
jgi:hypothetical protein